MESIYKPWQWPIPIVSILGLAISVVLIIYVIALLQMPFGCKSFKEFIGGLGYFFLGIIGGLFCCALVFISCKWGIQSVGKATVAIFGNYEVVEGYAEDVNMSFGREIYYSGTFSLNGEEFTIKGGGHLLGIAHITGEEKADLFNNYPIQVKYKKILGMNVIVSIDAITETG